MPSWEIIEGDAREKLQEFPDDSVHCVATSPPYYGLRDYGTGTWEGGNNPTCEHQVRVGDPKKLVKMSTLGGGTATSAHQQEGFKSVCGRCGARRVDQQIGLEETPDEYVAGMVAVFREVWRVLRPDGTVWLNLGDSYARTGGEAGGKNRELFHREGIQQRPSSVPKGCGLKEKDLIGIPWMVAFALRKDGWWLRSEVTWGKTNPMPESVTDRPTKSTEKVFLLTKSERYFYDSFAVREHGSDGGGRNKRDLWLIPTKPFPEAHFAVFPFELVEPCVKAGTSEHGCCAKCGAPLCRIIEKLYAPDLKAGRDAMRGAGHFRERPGGPANREGREFEKVIGVRTVGWEPTCECGTEETRPCLVLDPFAGSGTTLLVANRLGRDGVGIELSPDYAAMARRRLAGDMPLFAREAE